MASTRNLTLYDADGREMIEDDDHPDGFAVPGVYTFSGLMGGAWKTFWHGFHDEAIKHSRENALAMRRDAFIMGLLRERKEGTLSLKWHIECDNPKDIYQKTVADALTKIIKGVPRYRRIKRWLLEALWYGRYAAQVRWKWAELDLPFPEYSGPVVPGVKPTTTLRKQKVLTVAEAMPVNGDKIDYRWDGTPYILVGGSTPPANYPYSEVIPTTAGGQGFLLNRIGWRNRFLIHKHDPDDADYFQPEMAGGVHGVGIRSRIYWLDWLRKDWLGAITDALDRYGLGIIVIYYDASNAKAKEEAIKVGKQYSRRSVVVMPQSPDQSWKGGSIQVVETPIQGMGVLQQLIQHVEDHIERFIIGQTLSSATEGSGLGGTGVAEMHADTKQNIIAADAEDLDETITGSDGEPGLLNLIAKYTFPDADFPLRMVSDVDDWRADKKLESVTKAVSVGVSFPEAPVRQLTGIPAPEGDEPIIGGQQQQPGQPGQPGQPQGDPNADQPQDIDGLLDGQPGGEQDPGMGGDFGQPPDDGMPPQPSPNGNGQQHYDATSWDESKHKRGQPDNPGQFGPGGGGAKANGQPAAASANGNGKPAPAGNGSSNGTSVAPVNRVAPHMPESDQQAQQDQQKAQAKAGMIAKLGHVGKAALETAGSMNAAAKEFISRQVEKLPTALQLPVVGVYKLSRATFAGAQKAVAAVAKEKGHGDEHIAKVSAIVGVADWIASKTVSFGLGGIVGMAMPTGSGFVPLGSLAYLAWSTARNPLVTLRAARRGVASMFSGQQQSQADQPKQFGDLEPVHYADPASWIGSGQQEHDRVVTIHTLLDRMRRLGPSAPAWEASVYAALDKAPDLRSAIAIADRAYLGVRRAMQQNGGGMERYDAGWHEEDHPRGQPENKGQFAKSPGASGGEQDGDAQGVQPAASSEKPELTPEQDWKQNGTRSRAFKSWFGDWEHDQANASKVVSAKGEPQETHEIPGTGSQVKGKDGKPIAVYHGTSSGGFKKFDKGKVDKDALYGPGFYFTEDKEVAESYTRKGEPDFNLKKTDWESLGKFAEYNLPEDWKIDKTSKFGYSYLIPPAGKKFTRDGKQHNVLSISMAPGMARALRTDIPEELKWDDETRSQWNKLLDYYKVPAGEEIKAAYLNIRKPFDGDKYGNGLAWADLPEDEQKRLATSVPDLYRGKVRHWRNGKQRFNYDDLVGIADGNKSRVNEWLQHAGYDGITHIGGDRMGGGHHHRVWIAFEPNQIKSVNNRGTFDPNEDHIDYAGDHWRGQPRDSDGTWAESYRRQLLNDIEAAAAETDTDPSEAQKESGNYRKGKVRLHGLHIAIENPKGSTRSGMGSDGKPWSVKMKHHYGYIKCTESEADGDHVDCFIGPNPESEIVFVIDQVNQDGDFDEHKVMLGFVTEDDAKEGYLACYSPGWKGFGGIRAMTMDEFAWWLDNGDTGEPAEDQDVEHYEAPHPKFTGTITDKLGRRYTYVEGKRVAKNKAGAAARTSPAKPPGHPHQPKAAPAPARSTPAKAAPVREQPVSSTPSNTPKPVSGKRINVKGYGVYRQEGGEWVSENNPDYRASQASIERWKARGLVEEVAKPVPKLAGETTEIPTPDGDSVQARYEVRDLGSVNASNRVLPGGSFQDLVATGEYPAGLQPRNYTQNASEKAKVLAFASKMVPTYWISDHPDATSGPPVINEQGKVLSGNGRHMALEMSRNVGTYEKYKAALIKKASQFGLDPEQIRSMKEPALYRVVDLPEKEQVKFARAGNIAPTQSQGVAETAAAMSHLIPSDIADQLKLGPETTFSQAVTAPSGTGFRNKLLASIRSQAPTMEADLFERDGTLTEKGTEFVRQMLLTKFLPPKLIRDLGERRRQLMNGIEAATPQMLLLQRGQGAVNVSPQLREALEVFSRNPEMKTPADVDSVLSQGSLYGGMQEPITPAARMMLDFLVANRDTPSKLRKGLVGLAGSLHMKSGGLFGDQMGDTAEIAAEALGVQKQDGATFGYEGEVEDARREAVQSGHAADRAEETILRGEASADAEVAGASPAAEGPEPAGGTGSAQPAAEAGADEAVEPPEPGFTGTTTDSLGREYHWVNGKRVKGPEEVAAAREQGKPMDLPALERHIAESFKQGRDGIEMHDNLPRGPARDALYKKFGLTGTDVTYDLGKLYEAFKRGILGPITDDYVPEETQRTPTQSRSGKLGSAPRIELEHPEGVSKGIRGIALANDLADKLQAGNLTANELWEAANRAFGGTRAEGKYGPSDAYDALETAFNKNLSGKTNPTGNLADSLEEVAGIDAKVQQLPTQTNRSGNKEAFQQFSTPPHYAYAVNWLANIKPGEVVLEPSAGTGCLAVHAQNAGAEVFTNELDQNRADTLRDQFGTDHVFTENAEQISGILPKKMPAPSVVVMNPPFSQTAGRLGDKMDLHTAEKHINEGLELLQPGGRLVAIVGRGMSPASKTHAPWFRKMADAGYDLRANVGVNGNVYKKYGTTFDSRVLVFDKTGKDIKPPEPGFTGTLTDSLGRTYHFVDGKRVPGPAVTGDVQDIPSLMEKLEGIRNDRPAIDSGASGQPSFPAPAGQPRRDDRQLDDAHAPVDASVPGTAAATGPSGSLDAGTGGSGGGTQPAVAGDTGGAVRDGLGTAAIGPGGEPSRPEVGASEAALDGTVPADAGRGRKRTSQRKGGRKSAGEQPVREPEPFVSQLRPAELIDVKVADLTTEPKANKELGESLYDAYHPVYMRIEGMKPHTDPIVESAAMAGVRPPKPTYRPVLSPDLITGKKIKVTTPDGTVIERDAELSEVALETIVYMGQAHQQFLPHAEGEPAYRRGMLCGDLPGTGKGRMIAGTMLDNWNQGRKKHVWVTQKQKLFADAKRDWADLGQDPSLVIHFDDIRNATGAPPHEGICFITYDTLKGKDAKDPTAPSNLDKLLKWLGPDFDGVIAFDEAHTMGNALDTDAGQKLMVEMPDGSKQEKRVGDFGKKEASLAALAGLDLQKQVPNARVGYFSATPATEVRNLTYADRLGIWGEGTDFPTKKDFVNEMNKGGIAAMEAVAQSLKATGSLNSRSLSYDGVVNNRLSHKLTEEQRFDYDLMAEAWQTILQNMDKAIASLSGGSEKAARAANRSAASQFWGSQQRFFNAVLTSMQLPTVIAKMKEDLAAGRSPVLYAMNTGEATIKKAMASRQEGDSIEDLDLSPKQTVKSFLATCFPVHRREEYKDVDGNIQVRLVRDADGKPVEDPEAVRIRDEMIAMIDGIRIPDSPFDQIINAFGQDKVAEATGRSVRLVWEKDEQGRDVKVQQNRNDSAVQSDIKSYKDGGKPILLLSNKYGTGFSYHAEKGSGNQGQRVFYPIQPGWRADNALQAMGRVNRTNQTSKPIYNLTEVSDIPGHRRFISSIARRLDQLGSLGRGQRQTGSSGLFKAADNLESNEAQLALDRLFMDMRDGKIEELPFEDTLKTLGLYKEPKDGGLPPAPKIKTTQFMNRLLALKVDQQDKVFNAFDHRLQTIVEQAIIDGTLDTGVENFPAKLAKKDATVVYRDPASGATTHHLVMTATRKTPKRSWEENAKGRPPDSFAVNNRSGQIWAVYDVPDHTDPETGKVTKQYALRGPASTQFVPVDKFIRGFRDISDWQEAEATWKKEYAEIPDTHDTEEHFITGAMLPIWGKIPGKGKVYRVQTAKGNIFAGKHVPAKMVSEMLRGLGVESTEKKATTADIHRTLSTGKGIARLANGWKLTPARVGGEKRIELTGAGPFHWASLKSEGVIQEKVGSNYRLFVPTGEHGAKVLEKIIARNPITDFNTDSQEQYGDDVAPEQYAGLWDESKHPRGQPENAGQFGPGGGGKKVSQPAGQRAAKPKAPAPKPVARAAKNVASATPKVAAPAAKPAPPPPQPLQPPPEHLQTPPGVLPMAGVHPATGGNAASSQEEHYIDQAMANLKKTSRTASGVVDTSASAGKAAQIAEGLTGDQAAQHAARNFEGVMRQLYRERNGQFTPQKISALADQVNQSINKGITKEGVLLRQDDSAKYPYTAVGNLGLARQQFATEFAQRLADPEADPIETAAWVEWRVNMTDHAYADGVGKTSRALAAIPLMRAGLPLPNYGDNKEFYKYSQPTAYDPHNGGKSYLDGSWDSFKNYYKTKFPATTSRVVQAAEKEYPAVTADGRDSFERHQAGSFFTNDKGKKEFKESGQWSPQRQKLHDGISQKFRASVPAAQGEKIFTTLGGGPASGKSSIIHAGVATLPENHVAIDADALKGELPEYQGLVKDKNMLAAGYAHEESSYLAKRIQTESFKAGQHAVLDGTGDNSVESVMKKVNEARKHGYKVHAEYVTCSTEEAVRRNVERAKKTGRLPPEDMLRKVHKGVSQVLPALVEQGAFDNVRLWDTENETDGKPTLVMSGQGKGVTIHRQDLWEKFLAKGNE